MMVGRKGGVPMPDSTLSSLCDEIARSVHGEAWHGPALLEALARLTAGEASQRWIPAGHTAWEIALHASAWMGEVASRLRGMPPGEPARGDWPPVAQPTASAWEAVRSDIVASHAELERALAAFPAGRLGQIVGGAANDAPSGAGTTFAITLHGVAQHNAYHAGQIVLLGRAAGGR
jgi:hypothetical protein